LHFAGIAGDEVANLSTLTANKSRGLSKNSPAAGSYPIKNLTPDPKLHCTLGIVVTITNGAK